MALQWQAECKYCRQKVGYSDNLWKQDRELGRPRRTLCSDCEAQVGRELRAVALPEIPSSSHSCIASPLGGFRAKPVSHQRHLKPSQLDPSRFGVREHELHELYRQLSNPDVPIVIAVAPTGSGKSTYMPYRLFQPFVLDWFPPDFFTGRGQIVITQPRIAPTQEISRYVSEKLFGMDRGCGFDIGLKHSGNPACNWRNKMVYVTDGTLINWLAAGDIDKIGLIMIDEAHEAAA